ncbi:MAG: hypothetical protein HFE64_03965 [Lachnospiraceae bacterium]|jgi:predicted DNA-binding protein (MmcQ/YjbR family)|nr:hypothetical protein [Lachnospiraceae bacterium]
MKYPWIDEYLLNKRGVTKDLQADWNWVRYKIGDKMFAAICLDAENRPYYITIKLKPETGDFLRQQYEDIIPGFYMNKQHWNSVKPDGAVPEDLMKEMLDQAYHVVLGSFSGKKQRELTGLTVCGTECRICAAYGNLCQGCNETRGKVFHAQGGKACGIYHCSVNQKRLPSCAACDQLPCEIWKLTRDPSMTEEEFESSIAERVKNLTEVKESGI